MPPRPLSFLLIPLALLGTAQAQEPDGARPAGIPFFKGRPEPPAKLRPLSHKVAWVDTSHYLYEAYALEGASPEAWIARYVMLPEGSEGFREAEQVFLFGADVEKKPQKLNVEEVQVAETSLLWRGKTFRLVDRRDLRTSP